MKVKIFNSGKGWYISASNYKDRQDKAFMNIHFSTNHCEEIPYIDNGMGYSLKEIDIKEAIFTSYKGKIGLTIFAYDLLENNSQTSQNVPNNSNFGGNRADSGKSVNLGPDDLPFY